MSAQAGPRIEGHEAERLGLRGVDDLPDVDIEVAAHQRQLVDEPDVDRAERILQQLHHLRHPRRRDRHHGIDDEAVERGGRLGGAGVDPPDHLRNVARRPLGAARIDPLRREGEAEVRAGAEPARLEPRPHHFVDGAGIGGRLEYDELSRVQVRGNLLDRGDHVRQIRIAGLAQRGRDADVHRIDSGQTCEVGGRREQAGLDRRLQVGGGHVGDVGLAAPDGRGPLRVDVEADRRHPGAGERHDQRQPDIAEPDDADAHLSRGNALQQGIRHGVRVCRIAVARNKPPRTARNRASVFRHGVRRPRNAGPAASRGRHAPCFRVSPPAGRTGGCRPATGWRKLPGPVAVPRVRSSARRRPGRHPEITRRR